MVCGCCPPFRSRRRRNRGRTGRSKTNRGIEEPLLSRLDHVDDTDCITGQASDSELGHKHSSRSTNTTMSSDLSSKSRDLGGSSKAALSSLSHSRGGIQIDSDSLFVDSPSSSPLQLHHEHERTNTNPYEKYQDVHDDQLDDVQKLEKHCPLATHAERVRFLNAKGGKYKLALEQLTNYLEWRETHDLDRIGRVPNGLSSPTLSSDDSFHSCASSDGTLDQIDWKFASDKALTYEMEGNGNDNFHSTPIVLPQLARIVTVPGSDEHLCDLEGNRILHLLPAQMDPNVASAETFQLCIAYYLERKLGRDSMEKVSVVIDVRGGHGWANPKPKQLVPFIKSVSSCMEKNFPERLSKSVLFPMPRAAAVLWAMIKRFLDPNTAAKIAVIAGNAGTDAPPPYKKMEVHIERDTIELMEATRVETFS
jgi:hypothetical protein